MIIQPVYIDLTLSIISVLLGTFVFVSRMCIHQKTRLSPMQDIIILCLGSLGWTIFGFLATSAALDYGDLHSIGYRGHWGYFSGRLAWFFAWMFMLRKIYCSFKTYDKNIDIK